MIVKTESSDVECFVYHNLGKHGYVKCMVKVSCSASGNVNLSFTSDLFEEESSAALPCVYCWDHCDLDTSQSTFQDWDFWPIFAKIIQCTLLLMTLTKLSKHIRFLQVIKISWVLKG